MAYELLRTYIRQQLLQEGRKWVGDIAPMHKVLIEYSGDDYIDISVVHYPIPNTGTTALLEKDAATLATVLLVSR